MTARVLGHLRLACIGSGLLAWSACVGGGGLRNAPTRGEIDRAFRPPTAAGVDRGRPSATHDLDVYIDGSASMRGFAAIPESRFPVIVRRILESATTGKYRVSRFKYTSAITSIDELRINEIVSEDFYNGLDSPLSKLLERVGEHARRVSIIVSDMVQSDTGRDGTDLAAALSQLADKHMEMRLLAFRSNFDGDYFPESAARGRKFVRYRLTAKEGLPNTGRPFYILAIAPDRASLDLAQSYILQSTRAPQAFSPTDPPLDISKADFLSLGKDATVWNPFSQPELERTVSGSSRHYATFREYHPPKEKDSPLGLLLSGSVRMPFQALYHIRTQVRRAKYQGGKFAEAPQEVDTPMTLESVEGPKANGLKATYYFGRPAPQSWDVYEFSFTPGRGNLMCPDWVRNWSTDADELKENGNRTYQLTLLVETMIRSITENNVFCEQYLTVGRE